MSTPIEMTEAERAQEMKEYHAAKQRDLFLERRPTSSTKYPCRGLHQRIGIMNKAATQLDADQEAPEKDVWRAVIKKMSHCPLEKYDGGRGLELVWERGPVVQPVRGKRQGMGRGLCYFVECKGSNANLRVSIRSQTGKKDKNPTILHDFIIPHQDQRFTLRLSDNVRSICIADTRDVWVVHLIDDEDDATVLETKTFLRRLESTAAAMPAHWFKYRNFAAASASPRIGTQESSSSTAESRDTFEHHLPGGFTWCFSGRLAESSWKARVGAVDQDAMRIGSDDDTAVDDVTTVLSQTRRKKLKPAQLKKKLARRERVKARALEPEKETL